MEEKSIVFENILTLVKERFNYEVFEKIKTRNGNTQHAEGSYKLLIKNILIENGYEFKEAGSQQPYDFRISIPNGDTLYLELKKTDGYRICFNDTCPSNKAYYIIIYTAKTSITYEPQIIGVNGSKFIENCPWIEEYMREINLIKQKYSVSVKPGNMNVYPRPNLSSDIKFLLTKSIKEKKIKSKNVKSIREPEPEPEPELESEIESEIVQKKDKEQQDDILEFDEGQIEIEIIS
jgi:hypothetical protein